MNKLHIWITGASRGIGLASAQTLAVHHHVTVSSRTKQGLADVTWFDAPCDISNYTSVEAAHRKAVDTYGAIDVLINNAGIGIFKSVNELAVDEFNQLLDINLRGMFHCTKLVLPSMIERHKGMIIDVNSVATKRSFPNNAGYAATKAGALAFGKALREEVRSDGIKVVELILGATDTDIWHPTPRAQFQDRMMHPTDVAEVVHDVVAKFDNNRLLIEEVIIRPQLGDL